MGSLRYTFLVLLLLIAWSPSEARYDDPQPGTALRTSIAHHGFGWTVGPRQETINKVTSATNRSEDDVILRDINVRVGERAKRYGRIKRVLVGGPGVGGTFWTIPLVTKFADEGPCDVQRLSRVNGYRVAPKERFDIAIWVRPSRVGKFRAGPVEIVYEQAGEVYSQIDTYWIKVKIDEDWSRRLPKDVVDCAHLARLLPGNRID
jgi:hypothetical protein